MTTILKYGDADTEGTFDGTAQRQTLVGKAGAGFENVLYGDALELAGSTKGGNDMLIGGAGAYYNFLFGDADTMTNSQGGHDRLIGGAGSMNVLIGDAYVMRENSYGGHDVLTGGVGSANVLFGDAVSMEENSYGGHDVLTGGAVSTNILYGDVNYMEDSTGGHDVLTGGVGSTNELYGDAIYLEGSTGGHDVLTGGVGSTNVLYGDALYYISGTVTCGNDTLISSAGNDAMWGDIASTFDGNYDPIPLDLTRDTGVTTGQDVFVFSANNGQDTIHDFRQTDKDKIELQKMGVADFGALKTGEYLQENEGNTIITFDTNTITVIGVTGLTADDFLFT